MNELERVREQIADKLFRLQYPTLIPQANDLDEFMEDASQILSLKGIRIECDDQSLPENPYSPPLDETQEIWSDIVVATHKDMLKPDSEENHRVKVIKKEVKDGN